MAELSGYIELLETSEDSFLTTDESGQDSTNAIENDLKEIENFLREREGRESFRKKKKEEEEKSSTYNVQSAGGEDNRLSVSEDIAEELEDHFKKLQQSLKGYANLEEEVSKSAERRNEEISLDDIVLEDGKGIDSLTLQRELHFIISKGISSPDLAKSVGCELPSPTQVPATPPCTPAASTIGNHPLAPTEIYERRKLDHMGAAPPKPPRLYLPSGPPPRKPSRQRSYSENPAIKLEKRNIPQKSGPAYDQNSPTPEMSTQQRPVLDRLMIPTDMIKKDKMSKSTGNLTVLNESQDSEMSPESPRSAGMKQAGGRIQNLFSKWTSQRKNKRSHSLNLRDPSYFKTVVKKAMPKDKGIKGRHVESSEMVPAIESNADDSIQEDTSETDTSISAKDQCPQEERELGESNQIDDSFVIKVNSSNSHNFIDRAEENVTGTKDSINMTPNSEENDSMQIDITEEAMHKEETSNLSENSGSSINPDNVNAYIQCPISEGENRTLNYNTAEGEDSEMRGFTQEGTKTAKSSQEVSVTSKGKELGASSYTSKSMTKHSQEKELMTSSQEKDQMAISQEEKQILSYEEKDQMTSS